MWRTGSRNRSPVHVSGRDPAVTQLREVEAAPSIKDGVLPNLKYSKFELSVRQEPALVTTSTGRSGCEARRCDVATGLPDRLRRAIEGCFRTARLQVRVRADRTIAAGAWLVT